MTNTSFLSVNPIDRQEWSKDSKTEMVPINEQMMQTFQSLQEFRQKAQYTDVILCVGEEELPCHKVVLAAGSQYFNAMFSSPYKEQQTSHVTLDHVSPWALRRLLDFAYLGVLELSVTTVQDVFNAASLLDYPIAMEACVRFMEQHLDIGNCLGVEALAELHGLTGLRKAARKLAVENFTTLLIESNEWLSLPISSVISYISSDDLDVPSEQVVWDACMTWIAHEPENRATHLMDLLDHIRIRQLGCHFIAQQLAKNPYIQENRQAQDLLRPFTLRKCSRVQKSELKEWAPRPATLKRPTLVVLGGLNSCILSCMQSFSPSKTAWIPCPSMPVDSLAWFAAVVVSNVLYVIGGIKAGSIMSTVYSYSPSRGYWTQCCSMPQARARHAAVAVGGSSIFVFGGLSVSHPPEDDSEHTPVEQQPSDSTALWHSPESDTYRSNDERIPQLTIVNTIIRYDVRLDTWTTVGRTNEPRLESHVLIVDDIHSVSVSPFNQVDCPCAVETDDFSAVGDLSDASNASSSCSFTPLRENNNNANATNTGNNNNSGNNNPRRRRHPSTQNYPDRTIVEIGGITASQPHGTDRVSFYCLRSDLTVSSTEAYIKLPQQMRYLNCAVQPVSNHIYLFWEQTSELSVLDLARRTLRPLAPLVSGPPSSSSRARIHAGLTWVGSRLYVVGGFSEFIGDDRRPTLPRDDVHCYDPETNSWSLIKISNTTVPRAIFGCVCLNM